ncbi:hypothetical protein I5L01_14745 [Erythrobacter sp. YJ-T3-07]|uniref:hypothetical protein n=1 Tax=Erythrobacter sp. YJ-T3-07 TaxID=2793063 RepID=UPI0018D40D04|nr:hypothetical protein [Erythrobacter sp. YJ-T3-07]MBH1945483.1 hypothetical protein [Erythrobacter sp. YJ-T3-07]
MSSLRVLAIGFTLALLGGCTQGGNAGCGGTLITVPQDGAGFTVPQLMAHATAMGMNQQEAQTLIYLEGISPQATLQPGETICLDGKPDR